MESACLCLRAARWPRQLKDLSKLPTKKVMQEMGPFVIGTGKFGQAGLVLYKGLSMYLINAAFVELVVMVR